MVTSLHVATCLLCSSALYCISLSFTVSFLKVKINQTQSGDSCRTTVEDLEWGPDVHPEMWKSSTSSAGTDAKTGSADVVAVATGGFRRLGLVLEG